MKKLVRFIAAATTAMVLFTGCKGESKEPVELLGAGATFPAPLYTKMFDEYYNATKNKVNYQAIGSGGGIKQLMDKTVDFGATDAFLSDEDLAKSAEPILHIPTCIGAVVAAYNVPGNPQLKLSPETLSGIFLGKIKKWNDPALVAENNGAALPDLDIKVVTRSDSSGTTFVFTDYLSKISAEWKDKIGTGKSVNWPAEGVVSGKGNPGVAGLISQMPGSIGYIELAYATQNNISFAALKNKSGNYVVASLQTASLAANGEIPDDTRISISNTDVADGYPIATFTWLIFYKDLNYNGRTEHQAKELVKMLNWIETEGQQYNESLDYAKLPAAAVAKAQIILKQVTFNGKTLLK